MQACLFERRDSVTGTVRHEILKAFRVLNIEQKETQMVALLFTFFLSQRVHMEQATDRLVTTALSPAPVLEPVLVPAKMLRYFIVKQFARINRTEIDHDCPLLSLCIRVSQRVLKLIRISIWVTAHFGTHSIELKPPRELCPLASISLCCRC